MAHRRTLEEQWKLGVTEDDFLEISRSVNALLQSDALIEQIRDQHPVENLKAFLRLAEVFHNIGEAYNLSPYGDEDKMARDYFVRGEDIYRQIVRSAEAFVWGSDKDAEVSLEEVEIRWGDCCHKIGLALLTVAQGMFDTCSVWRTKIEIWQTPNTAWPS